MLPQLVMWLRPAFLPAAADRHAAMAIGAAEPGPVRTAIVFGDAGTAPMSAMHPVRREIDA